MGLLRDALKNDNVSPAASEAGYGSVNKPIDSDAVPRDDDSVVDLEEAEMKELREDEERMLRRLQQDGSFWAYLRGFRVFLPHMLPLHSKVLQLRATLVFVCLLGGNALNVLLPRQFGIVVDVLSGHSNRSVWSAATLYAGLLFLSSGCVGWLRYWLWLPIEQYGEESIVVAAHAHVMHLSSNYHDNKESYEINQAVQQGAHVTSVVDTICFDIFPMLVDLSLATAYLYYLFGPYLALVVAFTALIYIYTTTKLISLSNGKRRMLHALWRRQWYRGFYSVDHWTTASMFNNIEHEEVRYSRSVSQQLEAAWNYGIAYRFVAVAQVLVMSIGLLAASYLAIYQVRYGNKTAGDFATLFMYWAQLRAPLAFFSRVYKDLSDNMMDAERLLELLQTKPTITDHEHAKKLNVTKGEVIFSNVCHAYDKRKPGLQDVNFTVPGGTTVALVGETGSGKSTLIKLLNRFYEVDDGSITIDGHDVRDVTLESLRSAIATVPQEPAIFNGTIFNNVSYGRLGCTVYDVQQACKAAAIHDKIMALPDGYFSRVGRRGTKLSGGERQRLAIARAILKNSPIIVLDEATAALDTDTEHSIQLALDRLTEGHTTFVIAHRLSTIINADNIAVLKDGKIIESGTHPELLAHKGKYHDLWYKQINYKAKKSSNDDPAPAIVVEEVEEDNASHPAHEVAMHESPPFGSKQASPFVSENPTPFNPDAAEFFPTSHLRSHDQTEASETSAADDASSNKKATRGRKKKVKSDKGKKPATKSNEQVDGPVDNAATDDASGRNESTKVFLRQPHKQSRRNSSKSEPLSARLSIDGSADLDSITEDSFVEYTEMARHAYLPPGQSGRRRVTAPSDSQAELPACDAKVRDARRNSHWRQRDHGEVPIEESSRGSIIDDDVEYESTAAPAPSPAQGPIGSVGSVGLRTTHRI